MFSLGLLSTIIETIILIFISEILCRLLLGIKKINGDKISKQVFKGYRIIAFFSVLLLKLTSFYINKGGIEYRRIPLQYPLEIKETEAGTYIMSEDMSVETEEIGNYDIDCFKVVKNNIIFTDRGIPNSTFSYDPKTGKLATIQNEFPDQLKSFNSNFIRYHYFKVDSLLIAAIVIGFGGILTIRKHMRPVIENN
jgi:hypothetical protein